MTDLVLIRHGETDWNVAGRYQGQADPSLNGHGLEQARQLARELRSSPLDVVYTSPLKRAVQTAKIIIEALGIPLLEDPRLMEIHQGGWQTRLRSEIETLYPELFRRWETEPWRVTPPGGEHLSQVQERVYAAIDDILVHHTGQQVGVVTHRIPIALIKVRFQGMKPDIVRTLQLPNCYWETLEI